MVVLSATLSVVGTLISFVSGGRRFSCSHWERATPATPAKGPEVLSEMVALRGWQRDVTSTDATVSV